MLALLGTFSSFPAFLNSEGTIGLPHVLTLSVSFLVSVRVSNELGANHPKAAKFSVVVATTTSAAIGLVFTAVALAARKQMPRLFTGDGAVVKETAKLGYLLAATIFLNSIQPVLSGTRIE